MKSYSFLVDIAIRLRKYAKSMQFLRLDKHLDSRYRSATCHSLVFAWCFKAKISSQLINLQTCFSACLNTKLADRYIYLLIFIVSLKKITSFHCKHKLQHTHTHTHTPQTKTLEYNQKHYSGDSITKSNSARI